MEQKNRVKNVIILLLLIVIFSFITLSIKYAWLEIPNRWNPWAPLTIDQQINIVTKWKLNNLKKNPDKCLKILKDVPSEYLNYAPLEDYTPLEGCPLTNVVKIKNTEVEFNSQFVLSCPLAVAWLMFEKQRLKQIADNILGTSIYKINHFGSFSCRNINQMPGSPKSEHAAASALDISGFVLKDGSIISVLKHWENNKEEKKSEFLLQFRNEACEFFGTVLGPEYNSSHLNHFHIDNKNTTICR
ncbi:MAG: extensin family protein [Thermodesulfobacteriota bacterium]